MIQLVARKTNIIEPSYVPPLIKQSNENTQRCDNHLFKEHLSSLVNHVPLAMLCLDTNFNITNCSPAALLWLKRYCCKKKKNFSSAEVLEKKISDIFSPCPKSLKAALKYALKGKAWHSQPIKHEIKKGSGCCWLKWEIFPLLDKDSEVVDLIVCFEDVTTYQELLCSHKKLQQNNEILESFNIVLSHDLMQPLRQIYNFFEILQEKYRRVAANEDSIEYIFSALQKSFGYIKNLSEGMILYCREGDLTVEPEKISLKNLLDEVHENILKTKKYQLNLQFSDDIFLHANRTCMLQLFQNLLANAVKHSPDDNCIVTLFVVKEDNNFYKFSLHNSGYCPSHIRKNNLFLPFHSSVSEGAGLGLMICKKIVSAYKGKISLSSNKKRGTVVTFTLPIYEIKKCSQENSLSETYLKKEYGVLC